MFVPFSAFGITLWRRLLTRSVVLLSAGPFLEIALKNAAVPALSTWIGVTAATPLVEATSFCSVVRRGSVARGSLCALEEPAEEDEPDDDPEPPDDEPDDPCEPLDALELEDDVWLDDPDAGCAGVPSVTAMISGPLLPGPKFSVIRS